MAKNTIQSKFKKLFKEKIQPKLKLKNKLYSERNKLNSEINKLDSEIDKLYSERDKLYSEINKLDSERYKLYSERYKLNSEINKLNSEINKLYSEILLEFYKFEKESDCEVLWEDYEFKLLDIKLKFYNKDKTGFIYMDMQGKETEELFKPKKEVLEDLTKKQLISKIQELQGD